MTVPQFLCGTVHASPRQRASGARRSAAGPVRTEAGAVCRRIAGSADAAAPRGERLRGDARVYVSGAALTAWRRGVLFELHPGLLPGCSRAAPGLLTKPHAAIGLQVVPPVAPHPPDAGDTRPLSAWRSALRGRRAAPVASVSVGSAPSTSRTGGGCGWRLCCHGGRHGTGASSCECA